MAIMATPMIRARATVTLVVSVTMIVKTVQMMKKTVKTAKLPVIMVVKTVRLGVTQDMKIALTLTPMEQDAGLSLEKVAMWTQTTDRGHLD